MAENLNRSTTEDKLNKIDYCVLKIILIAATGIGGATLLIYGIIHAWKFLHAAMM